MKYTACTLLTLFGICDCRSKDAAPNQAPAALATAAVAAPSPAVTSSVATARESASAAPVASATPEGGAKSLTYAVFGGKSDDVLNVRAEPSASSKKVYSYAPSVKSIRGTGHAIEKDKTPWIEVAFE